MKEKLIFDNNINDKIFDMADSSREKFLKMVSEKFDILDCDTLERQRSKVKDPVKSENFEKYQKDIATEKTGFFGFCSYDDPQPEDAKGFGTYDNVQLGCMLTYDTQEKTDNVLTKNPKNRDDKRIFALALAEKAILVSEDKKLLRTGKKQYNKVMDFDEFKKYIGIKE